MIGMLDIKGNESIRRVYEPGGVCPALTTMQGGNRQPKIVEACRITGRNPDNPKSRESGLPTVQMLEVNKNPDVSNCLTTVQKDSLLLEKIRIVAQDAKIIAEKTRKKEIQCSIKANGDIRPHRMDVKKSGLSELFIINENNISNTVTASHSPKIYGDSTRFRIRKLTPRECFRLMGVSDSDIDKIQAAGISNSQQYKMAGNSIVVDCMKFLDQLA
jgi:DNA (cytosine-5)-methyltransferase 1